ncbi:MAG: hypothetical protein KBG16_12020 [Methanospirillum sp.]|nr:hypothetical protein [Methanospirillum sp.]
MADQNHTKEYNMTDGPVFLTMILIFLTITVLLILILGIFYKVYTSLNTSRGLAAVSQRWPAETIPSGKRFSRQSIAVGNLWYKNCANLVVANEGLYISLGFPFSIIGSNSTCILWKYLHYAKKGRAFWMNVYEYEIEMDDPIILTVIKPVATAFPERLKPAE